VAEGGGEMATLLDEKSADLVILDVNMPGEDGLTLARRLREHSDVCIIMLTAAGETVDRVVGLEMGADDYIGKPFDLRELLARVRTVLRRRAQVTALASAAEAPTNRVRFGRWVLDLDAHQLIGPDGSELKLTSMEFDLLQAFARHPNKVLSRDQLLDLAHRRDWEPFDRSIDIRITRIRRKIETDPAKPQIIKTIAGPATCTFRRGTEQDGACAARKDQRSLSGPRRRDAARHPRRHAGAHRLHRSRSPARLREPRICLEYRHPRGGDRRQDHRRHSWSRVVRAVENRSASGPSPARSSNGRAGSTIPSSATASFAASISLTFSRTARSTAISSWSATGPT